MKREEIVQILKVIQEDARRARAYAERLVVEFEEASTSSAGEVEEAQRQELLKVRGEKAALEKRCALHADFVRALFTELHYDLGRENQRASADVKDHELFQQCSELLAELRRGRSGGFISALRQELSKETERRQVAEKDSRRYQAECEERSKLLAELRHNYGALSESNHALQKKVRELEHEVAYEQGTARTMVDGCMRRDREIESLQEKVEALTNALAEVGRGKPSTFVRAWVQTIDRLVDDVLRAKGVHR